MIRRVLLASGSALALASLAGQAAALTYGPGDATYVAPVTGLYQLTVSGGGGAAYFYYGSAYSGLVGGRASGDFQLIKGETLYISVGAGGGYPDGYGGTSWIGSYGTPLSPTARQLVYATGGGNAYNGYRGFGYVYAGSHNGVLASNVSYGAGARGGALGAHADGYDGYATIIAPAPEPATWGLMITGFGLVGYVLRRRARRLFPPATA